jgi:hypothetical protein
LGYLTVPFPQFQLLTCERDFRSSPSFEFRLGRLILISSRPFTFNFLLRFNPSRSASCCALCLSRAVCSARARSAPLNRFPALALD